MYKNIIKRFIDLVLTMIVYLLKMKPMQNN